MMQKFRICAGGVKVWSAKLLMGSSWSGGLRASSVSVPGGQGRIATCDSRLCCEYGVCPEIAVEDVPAFRGELGFRSGSAAGSARAELADRTARTPAGGEDHRERHRGGRAAATRRDHRGPAGDQHRLSADPDWVGIGSGDWDYEGRESWVRLDRVLDVPEEGIRREGAILQREIFDVVAARLRAEYCWR